MSIIQGYSSDSDTDVERSNIGEILSTNLIDSKPQFKPSIEVDNEKLYPKPTVGPSIVIDKGTYNTKRPIIHQRGGNKHKRRKGNVEDDYLGPWASFNESDDDNMNNRPETNDSEEDDADDDEDADIPITENENDQEEVSGPTSEYFSKYNYDGGFMKIPDDTYYDLTAAPGSRECFVPKKVIHSYSGHENGVNKLEFFPNSGHLLLSCGNDSIIRLWDIYYDQALIREYYGHSRPVKDIKFNNQGDKFLSCSFDKKVHLWETELGKILHTLKLDAIPTTIMFNPNDNDEILIGLRNNKIEHYVINDDANIEAGESNIKIVQTYDYHMGPINVLIAVDKGKYFLSASDDKSVRVWNWGINIPIKTILHPTHYSTASVALTPDNENIALQNMNNLIQVIDGHGKFKFKKRSFKNNNITGYKIDIDISPDGKILCSGDSKGFGLFWDWKSGKLVKKFKISDKLISTIKFHPQEQSKVAAGGNNGKIYYCD